MIFKKKLLQSGGKKSTIRSCKSYFTVLCVVDQYSHLGTPIGHIILQYSHLGTPIGHIILQDLQDLDINRKAGWRKVNTLQHYGVKEKIIMSVVPK